MPGNGREGVIMKTMSNLCMVVVSTVFYAATVWGFTESDLNKYFVIGAGANTTGVENTFVGVSDGYSNTTGNVVGSGSVAGSGCISHEIISAPGGVGYSGGGELMGA